MKRVRPFGSTPSSKGTQARGTGRPYLQAVADFIDANSMLYWLARTCADHRKRKDRLQVHIAAELNVTQSTIDRFEDGIAWPRNADQTVAAYAGDLNIAQIELWEEALRRWRDHLTGETREPGAGGPPLPSGELGRRALEPPPSEEDQQRPGSQREQDGGKAADG